MLDKKLNACCYSNKVKKIRKCRVYKNIRNPKSKKKNTKSFEQTCDLKLISNAIWRKNAKILYQMNYSAA